MTRFFMTTSAAISCAAIALLSGHSRAEEIAVEKCNAALVQATYTSTQTRFRDWRMAQRIDETTYNEIKKNAGANAVIYGVPMGANWSDFQKNISGMRNEKQESLTESEFRNIAWTGLEDNNVKAYNACIDGLAQAAKLALTVVRATESEVTVRLHYNHKGLTSPKIAIIWSGSGRDYAYDTLPPEAVSGPRDLILKRPAKGSATLGVYSAELGDTGSVVLMALPAPLPPPDELLATSCQISNNDAVSSLSNGQSGSWLCPKLKAGKYLVSFSLGGGTDGPRRVMWYASVLPSEGTENRLPGGPGWTDFLNRSTFQTSSHPVTLPDGAAQVRLTVFGVYPHNDFQNANGGAVTLDKNINIKFDRFD